MFSLHELRIKTSESTGDIEAQYFGFGAPMLCHLAAENSVVHVLGHNEVACCWDKQFRDVSENVKKDGKYFELRSGGKK